MRANIERSSLRAEKEVKDNKISRLYCKINELEKQIAVANEKIKV